MVQAHGNKLNKDKNMKWNSNFPPFNYDKTFQNKFKISNL